MGLLDRDPFEFGIIGTKNMQSRTPHNLTGIIHGHHQFADRLVKFTEFAADHQLTFGRAGDQIMDRGDILHPRRSHLNHGLSATFSKANSRKNRAAGPSQPATLGHCVN